MKKVIHIPPVENRVQDALTIGHLRFITVQNYWLDSRMGVNGGVEAIVRRVLDRLITLNVISDTFSYNEGYLKTYRTVVVEQQFQMLYVPKRILLVMDQMDLAKLDKHITGKTCIYEVGQKLTFKQDVIPKIAYPDTLDFTTNT